MELLVYIGLGAVAGVLAGLLGVGGGLVIVPGLLWLFHIKGFAPAVVAPLAVGTSLTSIVFTALASMYAHHRRGAVRWDLWLRFVPGLLLGAWLGAMLGGRLPSEWLVRTFGLFALAMALRMALPGRGGAAPLPGGWMAPGAVIGAISALVGVGGGTLVVPFLHARGIGMRESVATSSACGGPIALSGAIGFAVAGWGHSALPPGSLGFVYGAAVPGIVVSSMLLAPLGARLAHALPVDVLRRAFALLLAAIGLRLLIS